jgi:hypothetical protein
MSVQPNDVAQPTLSPDRVLAAARGLTRSAGPGEPATVEMDELLDALLGSVEPGDGHAAWLARVALKRRLIALLADMPALHYIPGDS